MTMLTDFDPDRPGKHLYEIPAPEGATEGVSPETLACIRNGEGPSVLLIGGIHGDEYEAQIVLRELIGSIAPAEVTGRLIIVPSVNFPASQRGGRVSPFDGRNMNRTFPGDATGAPTDRLSAFVHDGLFPLADLLIDVHAGGSDVTVVPMVFGFTNPGCKLTEADLTRVLEAWGYPYIEHVTGIDETACGASPKVGVTSIEIEGGGGGRLSRRELTIMRDGILRGLAAAGVMAPRLPAVPFQGVHVTADDANRVNAPAAGLIEHLVGLGDIVARGQAVALLHPIAGGDAAPVEVLCAKEGHVLRQTDQVFVGAGQYVLNTGTAVHNLK